MTPEAMKQVYMNPDAVKRLMIGQFGAVRFRVDGSTGCWDWNGATSNNGYARLGYNNRVVQGHRFAYAVLRGEITHGFDLDHLCRNRKCVNPWHLEPVTRAINARRGVRGKLKQADVDEIRRRHASGPINQTEIGKEFGVHGSVVSEIVNWKIWK